MLGERYSVKYVGTEYVIFLDGQEVRRFMGYNISIAYLVSHGVLHTDANNLLTSAFENTAREMQR